MLFLKRLSDAFEEAQEAVIQYYLDKGKTQEQAEVLSEDKDEYDKTFYVPAKGRWQNLKDLKHDIGAELNIATEAIEEHNPTLEGVLVSIDFNIKNKLIGWANKQNKPIEFEIVEELHEKGRKLFVVAVMVAGESLGSGRGFSKKDASQMAAIQAAEKLGL
jgi:type I restriction-modification system DNA methylase subunit